MTKQGLCYGYFVLPDRLMVGQRPLEPLIGVRIPVGQPRKIRSLRSLIAWQATDSSCRRDYYQLHFACATRRVFELFVAAYMHTVYVLENQKDKSWYIGQTDNLKRRLEQHNSGNGGRTTKIKIGPWKLMYAEAYCDKRDAVGRERFLKGGSGGKYLQKQLAHYLS